jgi:uncharacterized membrane protein YhaH (DUF805 family)
MENFYLFLICFFLCGMILHILLIDQNSEKLEASEPVTAIVNGLLLLICTLLIFGITLGIQYRFNDYLFGR